MEKRNLRKKEQGLLQATKWINLSSFSEVKRVKHPMYGKFVLRTKNMLRTTKNDCNIGDTVRIMETRPLSKTKCWRLVEIIERAK